MRKKAFSVLVFLLVFLGFYAFPAATAAESITAETVGRYADDVTAYRLRTDGVGTVQEWLDSARSFDTADRWYALAFMQSGNYAAAAIRQDFARYTETHRISSAVTKQGYALVLAALGSDHAFISYTLDTTVGEQGIMSLIYGLHLLNNGYRSERCTAESVRQTLLALALPDGGFAVTGTDGDVDVTAMALTALAPYYDSCDDVRRTVDNALRFLSSRQLADGDFSSYGTANAESTAQVVIALSALGIDAANDPRFIKNGCTPFHGLAKYRLESGAFSHVCGGQSNDPATVQAFSAFVAYLRFTAGKTSLYILDKCSPADVKPASDYRPPAADGESAPPSQEEATTYKPWLLLGIAAVTVAAVGIMLIRKRKRWQEYVVILATAAVAVVLVLTINIRTPEDYYGESVSKDQVIGNVSFSVRCDAAIGRTEGVSLPEDGCVIAAEDYAIADGDTVYTILTEAAKRHRVALDARGTGKSVYVAGIGGLYEFMAGDLSGWVYYVNGVMPSVGCGEYRLSDGDTVVWVYTLTPD